jgi:hypothetical protein
MAKKTTKWGTYEEVARQILHDLAEEFGLERVEPKQKVIGQRSGTEWEIDAKGVRIDGEGFVIVECRRYTTSKQSQEKVGGLAYRIIDTGAKGGIVVSPLGVQEGGEKVAQAENIASVLLDENATPEDFVLRFLNKIFVHMTDHIIASDSVSAVVHRKCEVCGTAFVVAECDVSEAAVKMVNANRCDKCQNQ